MSTKQKPNSIYYFSSTHWDREWYLSFQSYRFRLVKILKEILDTLETDPDFTQFILDGQTVVLEDYLEIKKEDRLRVETFVKENRLKIGPWYTMPDENLVSGESLIQNLFLGHAIASSFSENNNVLNLGYLCDCFGHISQMPQILNGFHIKNALLGRGTNRQNCPSYFLWEAPDGSQCATYKVPESLGYGTFWSDVYVACEVENLSSNEEILKKAIEYVKVEQERSPLPYVLLMDGMDHTPIHKIAPWLTQQLAEYFKCEAHLGNIDKLFSSVWQNSNQLPIMKGELQEPAKDMEEHNRVISGTLSSRYDLKKYNDRVQNLIEKSSQPLSALSALHGHVISPSYLATAYRYLIKNHAHDSICGCSIDEVHRDMHYRFRQAEGIAKEICDTSMAKIADLQEEHLTEGTMHKLTLFNPLPFTISKEIEADLWLPENYPCKFDEMIPSEQVDQFHLLDCSSQEVEYQIIHIKKDVTVRTPEALYGNRKDCYRICFTAHLPAMGYVEYNVVPSYKPVRFFRSMKTSEFSAENEFICLTIARDGSISVYDKKAGYLYSDLVSYKDNGETGDGWTFRSPIPDRIVYNTGAVSIETTQDGPSSCTFCITHVLSTPTCMVYHRQYTERDDKTIPLVIKTYVTLTKSASYIQVATVVENNVSDHRLLLSLKTGIESETYVAEQAFTFVERTIDRNVETNNWKEADRAGKSFAHIVYRQRKDNSGFAFISKGGLHECAALRGCEGRLDVCLFRSFEKTFLTDGQPDGQLQGTLIFDYLLVPFRADITLNKLVSLKDIFQSELIYYTSPVNNNYTPQVSLPGFYLKHGIASISTIMPARNYVGRTLVRLINYTHTVIHDTLCCPCSIINADETDLLEKPIKAIGFGDCTVDITLNPQEIKTISLCF